MTTHQPWLVCFVAAAAMSLATEQAIAQTTGPPPLQLESKIALGDVRGRIDHMAIDLPRQRLFVAELGNDSVGIVDLRNRKLISTIGGLNQPHGVVYVRSIEIVSVSNAS